MHSRSLTLFPAFLAISAVSLAMAAPTRAATLVLLASEDTSISENTPTIALGGDLDVPIGTTNTLTNGQDARGLFKFDLAGQIPGGATIDSVTLTLSVVRQSTSPASSTYGFHRMQQSWNPSATTWNTRVAGTPWTTPGAQDAIPSAYAAASSGTTPVIASVGTFTTTSTAALVADVQGWVDAPSSNLGWMLISDSEGILGSARRFAMSEYGTPSSRPQLTVNYTVPEPGTTFSLLGGAAMLLHMRRRRERRA